jgi:hypothetical protein
VSITQQSATPKVASRPRRPLPSTPAPPRRPGRALAKIGGLVACTALAGALAAGVVGLSLVMLISSAGH